MRHVSLTCKNHPNLRWACKEAAWSGFYNGSRHIFFKGQYTGKLYADKSGAEAEMFVDGKFINECSCPSKDLVLAPEDAEIKAAFDTRHGTVSA